MHPSTPLVKTQTLTENVHELFATPSASHELPSEHSMFGAVPSIPLKVT